ncbi:unnamed protein product [Prorocentrum cordatum]|nr:unnamed protein product [Polarella glacialis]
MHMLLALAVNQALQEYYFQKSQAEEQVVVFEYFGSFSRSLLTMFEFTLANWAPPARVLMENVHEALFIYSVVHKMALGFAVIGIINGVSKTFKVASSDDAVMVRQMYRKEKMHTQKMQRLFVEADANGDGTIELDEWLTICEDQWVQIWLKSQDLDATDPGKLFTSLDDGSGTLTVERLVEGTARLKSQCSAVAVITLLKEVHDRVKDIETTLHDDRAEVNPVRTRGDDRFRGSPLPSSNAL